MQDVKQVINERLAVLRTRKADVESIDYDALIAEELAKVKAQLVEKYEVEKALKLDKIELEIKALDNWLAEEQANQQVQEPTKVQPAVAITNAVPSAFQRFKTL